MGIGVEVQCRIEEDTTTTSPIHFMALEKKLTTDLSIHQSTDTPIH